MVRSLLLALSVAAAVAQLQQPEVEAAFEAFKARFGRTYSRTEEIQRFTIFQQNVKKIEAHNAQNLGYKLGVTRFSDMTQEEFLAQTAGVAKDKLVQDGPRFSPLHLGAQLPETVDWVAKGAVTPVKDQGGCSSCWAFAATGALEGAYFVATGQLVSISEQIFVSCYEKSCNPGLAYVAINWAESHDLCTEASYPYGPYPGTKPLPVISACNMSGCQTALPKGAVTGYQFVTPKNESALMEAVAQQPVAVQLDGGALGLYHSGIISGACAQYATDHAVLVVGYGTDDGVDYWKVKNSWSDKFGEDGYFRVKRNDATCANYKTGAMGILEQPVVPTLSVTSEIVV